MIQNIEHEIVVYNKLHDTLEVVVGSSLFYIKERNCLRCFPVVTQTDSVFNYLGTETFLEDYEILGEI